MVGYELLGTPQRDITAEAAARGCANSPPYTTLTGNNPGGLADIFRMKRGGFLQ